MYAFYAPWLYTVVGYWDYSRDKSLYSIVERGHLEQLLHHRKFTKNFGFDLFMDRLMGTYESPSPQATGC